MPRITKRLTLRSQILALTLAVGLPAAAGVGWALSMVLDSEKAAANAKVRSASAQVANNLALLLRDREALLATLAAVAARPPAGTGPCTALATEWPRLPVDRATLALHALDGQRLCGSGPSLLAVPPQPGNNWFQQGLRSAGFAVGPVLPVLGGGAWTAPLTYPVRAANGQPVGLLVLPLDLLALQRQVMPPPPSPALVAVIDGNDALLMRSVDAPQWQGKLPPPNLAARARDLRDGVLGGPGLDGQRRLFGFAGVADTPWRVVAGVAEDQVLAHYQTLLRTSVAAGVLGLLGMLLLARRLGNRIVRPIGALAAVSARVAAGDGSARAEVAGPAEIAAVATQFNQMLDASKASQQALAASEAQLRFLVDHLFAGLVVHAPDGRVLLANARASELLGLTVAQMDGKAPVDPAWRFLREDGRTMPVDEYPVMRVIQTGQPLTDFVGAIDRAAGADRVWVIVNAYPQHHDGGRLRQVVVSFVDISARMRAEQTLAASEARFRMLFENSLDGVLQTRPDGSVLAANPAACAIFGLDEAALCARRRQGLVDMTDPRGATMMAQRTAQGRITMLRGDGSRFEAELATMLYTGLDGEALSSVVVRDISQQLAAEQARARLEVQLRESQKMEAIGTLAGGIAHDFNNILGGLLGNAALALDHLADDHPTRAHLLQIERAGQRARSLVQQILAFSRRQTQPMAPQRHALGPLVGETLALLHATLPAGAQLVATLADEAIEVDCDATQIQQVLMNLCTNAWHALGGQPGRIGVRLERVDLGRGDDPAVPDSPIGLPAGPYAHLQVIDTGVGMDDATRARIFEPFFTTKPVGQGTGLGLSVVHGIVVAHRGAITVHSRPGEGSCFDVYLPLADRPQAAAAAGPAVPAPAGHGQPLLYVDDDEVMLLMVGQLLQRAGYRVTGVPRVVEALAVLQQDPQAFDLVITDFNLPDGSGLDVARAALQQRPDRPVVLSSGYLSEDARVLARALGVQAILMKEHTVEQLPALVARLLAPAQRPPA